MEKTFIMSVKKKYEVHVTTDLNCKEVYIPAKRNKTNLEKLFEDLVSIPAYLIYLVYSKFCKTKTFITIEKFFCYTNHFFECLSLFGKLILYLGILIMYVIGMATSDLRISILVSVFSLFLTCSLLSKFEWTHIEFCILINISFALLTSIILIRLSPYITMPKWLKFLSLNNLGNTITYICIMITLIDLAIGNNHKY